MSEMESKTDTRIKETCSVLVVQPLSHVRLSVTHGLYPTRLFCPWDFPGKNTEWVAISFFRGSSQPRDRTHISCTAGTFFTY